MQGPAILRSGVVVARIGSPRHLGQNAVGLTTMQTLRSAGQVLWGCLLDWVPQVHLRYFEVRTSHSDAGDVAIVGVWVQNLVPRFCVLPGFLSASLGR